MIGIEVACHDIRVLELVSGFVVENPAGLLGAAYVGVIEMGVAFVMWLSALRLSENTARVGNLIFLSPFVSLFFIRSLVGEEILGATILGLALVVAGIAFQGAGRRTAAPSDVPGSSTS